MKVVYGEPAGVDILTFGVHPDDIELSCSGTVLKHIDQGYTVGIVDFTEGELGTRGDAPTRLKESEVAAGILGVRFRINIGMRDGFFKNDESHILQLVDVIRRYKPKLVLANSIEDRHPDHGRAASLAKNAFFYSGLGKIQGLPPYRADALFHYIQDKQLKPDICVDVSEYVDKKMASIAAFESQFHKEGIRGPQTPISGANFLAYIRSAMASFGRSIGVDSAEGFIAHRTIGTHNLMNQI